MKLDLSEIAMWLAIGAIGCSIAKCQSNSDTQSKELACKQLELTSKRLEAQTNK